MPRPSLSLLRPQAFGTCSRASHLSRGFDVSRLSQYPRALDKANRPARMKVNALMAPRTLYEKIWDAHIVHEAPGQPALIYIDRHLLHEGTSPQAFSGLAAAGRKVRRPDLTFAVMDHSVPTKNRELPILDPDVDAQFEALAHNCAKPRPAVRHEQQQSGNRPRDRSRAGHHAAGTDDRLRRQPHFDARRIRRAGFRHRHERNRARPRHAMSLSSSNPRPCA